MANFSTVKTFGGLSGEKHPIIHAVVGKINVVREDNIGFNQNIMLAYETTEHDSNLLP